MATAVKARIAGRGFIRRVYGVGPGLLVVLAGGLLAAVPLGGCASNGGSEAGPEPTVSTLFESDRTALAVRATEVLSPGREARTFEVFDRRKGEPIGAERHESGPIDAEGRWGGSTLDAGGAGDAGAPPRHAGYRLLGDGSVAMEWSRSVKDTDPDGPARLYLFDPPLVMMPATLAPGEEFEHASRMTEMDPADETRVAMSGRARRTARVVLPGGEGWDADWTVPDSLNEPSAAVVGELRITVGPASAVRTTVQLLVGNGVGSRSEAVELVDFSIRVLGIPFKRERTRAVLRTEMGDPGADLVR